MIIKTSEGQKIPIGRRIIFKKECPSGQNHEYWINDYSEYVVPKGENIMVRYVIKFGDGTKAYTRKDLYMVDGIESQSNEICIDDDKNDIDSERDPDNESEGWDDDNDSIESSS